MAALAIAECALRLAGIQPATVITKQRLINLSDGTEYDCYPTNPRGAFDDAPDVTQGTWRLQTFMLPPSELPLSDLAQTPWCVAYRYRQAGNPSRQDGIRLVRDVRTDAPDQPPTDASRQPPTDAGDKPHSVARIAGIGDSFAFGEGVPGEGTLFAQMEMLLGERYQIINAAKSGANLHEEVIRLAELLAEPQPVRRAIVVFTANDIGKTPDLRKRQAYVNDLIMIRDENLATQEAHSWLALAHLRLAQVLGSRLVLRQARRATIAWYHDLYKPDDNARNLVLFEHDLARLARLDGCRVVYVLYPLMEGLENEYPLAEVHHAVATMARNAGLPVFDLAPIFAGQPTSALWVHPADHHPNETAHALAAKAIVDWLRQDHPDFLDAE